jgi:hypothetical protein
MAAGSFQVMFKRQEIRENPGSGRKITAKCGGKTRRIIERRKEGRNGEVVVVTKNEQRLWGRNLDDGQ